MGEKEKTSKIITAAFFLTMLTAAYWLASGAGAENDKKGLTIGERFHKETSLTWLGALGDLIRSKPAKPMQFKKYPQSKIIKLPKPEHRGISVEEAIAKRRSVRNYSSKPLSLAHLSQLLFAAQGKTGRVYGQYLRTAPSAGALYPFEIYIFVNSVENLQSGIYHYAVVEHALELLKEGDFGNAISNAALKQEMLGDAAVTFVLSAIFDRIRHKYGERGYRYVYIEAGHISQNIYLQAVSLGLGSVAVGAFLDEKVNKLIGADGAYEAAIYLHSVGNL